MSNEGSPAQYGGSIANALAFDPESRMTVFGYNPSNSAPALAATCDSDGLRATTTTPASPYATRYLYDEQNPSGV